jgi:hypothetical protein
LSFFELLLGQGFMARCAAWSQFICQQAEVWRAFGALQAEVGLKEAELASLRASSAERLAAVEEERVTSAMRLAEAQRQAKSAQAAFDAFVGKAARMQAELETRVAELTTTIGAHLLKWPVSACLMSMARVR